MKIGQYISIGLGVSSMILSGPTDIKNWIGLATNGLSFFTRASEGVAVERTVQELIELDDLSEVSSDIAQATSLDGLVIRYNELSATNDDKYQKLKERCSKSKTDCTFKENNYVITTKLVMELVSDYNNNIRKPFKIGCDQIDSLKNVSSSLRTKDDMTAKYIVKEE